MWDPVVDLTSRVLCVPASSEPSATQHRIEPLQEGTPMEAIQSSAQVRPKAREHGISRGDDCTIWLQDEEGTVSIALRRRVFLVAEFRWLFNNYYNPLGDEILSGVPADRPVRLPIFKGIDPSHTRTMGITNSSSAVRINYTRISRADANPSVRFQSLL